LIPVALLHRMKLVADWRMRLILTGNMATLYQGMANLELEPLVDLVADRICQQIRPDIRAMLEQHQEQGHRVVLISSMFQPFLKAIGDRLAVDSSIGTGLEHKDGIYTGRLLHGMCFDTRKAGALNQYLEQFGPDVDLVNSYAYGDTIWDRPVLQMVGNPVAVHPDPALRDYARQQAWRVID